MYKWLVENKYRGIDYLFAAALREIHGELRHCMGLKIYGGCSQSAHYLVQIGVSDITCSVSRACFGYLDIL